MTTTDIHEKKDTPTATTTEWIMNILLPNVLRFVQGIIVMFISFVIIVQSDNIIDLLKDFTALMILSETDNIFFGLLAAKGYFGHNLQRTSIQARNVEIEYEASSSPDLADTEKNQTINDAGTCANPSGATAGKGFFVRSFILSCLTMIMIGSWAYIVMNQINGVYFDQKYPDCKRTVPNAFQLATEHFGDGVCYGGPLNTLECQFEDGDCMNFNTAYPLCKGDDRTNAEERVGDDNCDAVFMNADCNYDGGDCCPYINDPSFGDGICNEEMNTEGCGYDNGDCIDYNRDFAGCPHDVVFNNPTFGDGQCNGGISSTAQCGYDNGDCNPLRIAYPDCPFDTLSNMTGADNVILGDGICDNSGYVYLVKECGFEYGDCNQGQVGQRIVIPDDVRSSDRLFFNKVFSLDGSTLALGLYYTDKDGHYDPFALGVVKVWRFNTDRKLWLQLGETIESPSGQIRDSFGQRMSMSASGTHIAISSKSGLRVYELNNISGSNGQWIQVGQTLNSTYIFLTYGIISEDGSRVALGYDSNNIHIYNLQSNLDGQTWTHDDDLDTITVDDFNYMVLRFAASDGSILLFTDFDGDFVKAFQQTSPDVAWTQMGQNIKKSPSSSMAISLNGNRIAAHRHSTDTDTTSGASNSGQDEVQVLDFDGSEWLPVGDPIVSSSPIEGPEFGYNIEMSADGNFLLVGVNRPDCRSNPNRFDTDKCTKSSQALFELYIYVPSNNQFMPAVSRQNVEDTNNMISDGINIIHGLHFSLSNNKNGANLLSVSNYNLDDHVVFVDVIDLDELYYTKCAVEYPSLIGDGACHGFSPYNTEACGFDRGDCL